MAPWHEELAAFALAARHPHTPRRARVLLGLTLAYALSPIDLIPDFIPVLGLADDALLVPLGLWLARRAIPESVMRECRREARGRGAPAARGALLVLLTWAGLALAGLWLWLALG